MTGQDRPADRIRKLVTLAASGDTPEAAAAAAKARDAIARLNTELLDTLAGQRARLMEDIHEEQKRLYGRNARPGADTRDLMDRARLLFGHYERVDALIAAVMLERIARGERLTGQERQQLDGPVEDMLDRFMRGRREERQAERERKIRERRERRRQDESTTGGNR